MSDIKGLQQQVAWCIDSIKKMLEHMPDVKSGIQDPPDGPPPTNPNP